MLFESILVDNDYEIHLYLYSALPRDQLQNLIREYCIDEEIQNIEQTLEDWEQATKALRKIEEQETGLANNNVTFDITNPKLDEIAKDVLFKNTFEKTPTEFRYIDIDNVVAFQRQVSLSHVGNLEKKIPDNPTEEELIDICVSPKTDVPIPKPTRKTGNSWVFTSPSTDFRFLGGYLKEQITEDDIKYTNISAVPTHAITLFVGYGTSTINVIEANGRLILNNGFHRVYTFFKKGIKRIPVVVQKVGNVDIDFPPHLNHLKQYLIVNKRPVVIKDFFDSNLVKEFKQKKMIKTVRVDFIPDETALDV